MGEETATPLAAEAGEVGAKTAGELVDEVTAALLNTLADHVNLTAAHRRLQWFARLLICITFIEDATRMLTSFKDQTITVIAVANAGMLPISPQDAWMVIVFSAVLQATASAAVLLEKRELLGCIALIVWCFIHPVIYAQTSNFEFMAETLTVVGGLCILLSHLKEMRAARATILPGDTLLPGAAASDRLCLLGRVLLCAYFVYYGLAKMRTIVVGGLPLQASLLEGVLVMLLGYVCVLIVVGSRSRRIALGLACIMFVSNIVFHPFWYFWMIGHSVVSVDRLDDIKTRLPIDLTKLGTNLSPESSLSVYDHGARACAAAPPLMCDAPASRHRGHAARARAPTQSATSSSSASPRWERSSCSLRTAQGGTRSTSRMRRRAWSASQARGVTST